MKNLIPCVFCNNLNGIISCFTKDTLKKCKHILIHRKEHNLKYKDVILPNEISESGFHRQCYKSFTALQKRYYSPKESSHAPEDLCSVFIYNSQALEPQQFLSNSSNPAPTDSTTVLEPSIITVNHPIPSHLQENSINSESQDFICEYSIPTANDESTDSKKTMICIFCDKKGKKQHSKWQPLRSTDKKNILAKLAQKRENNLDLIFKIENLPDSNVYYHPICKHFLYEKKKKEIKSIWHDCRQYHQSAFKEMVTFIQENVIEKQQCYFLSYLHRYYIAVLENDVDNIDNVIGNYMCNHLEDKIVKHFKKEIKLISVKGKKLLASNNLTAIDDQYLEMLRQKDIIQKAALLLRKSIL